MKRLLCICVLPGICLLTAGCATVRLANAKRLIARPDFAAARQAAPEWCRDALKTINQLEFQLERQ